MIVQRIADSEQLDGPASALAGLTEGRHGRIDLLRSGLTGHPLHPVLTDVTIGFWTSSWLLDVLGGAKSAGCSQADRVGCPQCRADGARRCRRSSAAVAAEAPCSRRARSDERHRHGPLPRLVDAPPARRPCVGPSPWAWCAAATATVGGFLGGHLVFGADDSAS